MVLCVIGPTASGKTALSVELALKFGGEVISCDSMQIYRGMDIGTAKPTAAERKGVPHHMIDVCDPSEPYSAARYAREASACADDILKRGRLPVITGGTGLYLNALLYGIHRAEGSAGLREDIQRRNDLHTELSNLDPAAAARLHPNDKRRIVRALEVYYSSGRPISEHHEESKKIPPRWKTLIIGIRFADRAELYERIERRVDRMLELGLPEEINALLSRVPPPCHTALQAIGYKELGDAEAIKRNTRRYAKRQMTWFGKMPDVQWIDFSENILGEASKIAEIAGLHKL
ncbi:MAG: tRNA (adenosine(37)-N6)-dimethylallyltransferase MiaA [Oscillospiraceae bacterium]|nr:tRNA (adenosine(37)-N6)-dimethylallyltransferase MiaA [Oscillospiraceae bacterium]